MLRDLIFHKRLSKGNPAEEAMAIYEAIRSCLRYEHGRIDCSQDPDVPSVIRFDNNLYIEVARGGITVKCQDRPTETFYSAECCLERVAELIVRHLETK
jgi:hypothetical protein